MRWNRLSTLSVFFVIVVLALPLPRAFALAEGTFQRTLQVTGPVNLDLQTGSGNVQVRTGSANQVQITGHIKLTSWFGNAEERIKQIIDNPPIQQSGNDVRIGKVNDAEFFHNISISYEVAVPPQTRLHSHTGSGDQDIDGLRDTVEVESGSGELKVTDIGSSVRAEAGSGNITLQQIKGEVRARTGSGSIRATDVAGSFDAHTGSGHIVLEQSAPGSVRAETGSGGMELRGVQGSLEATAGSGDVRAEGNPTGNWAVHTGSGSVRLKLTSDAAFDLNARTSSGEISVRQPVTVQGTVSRKELRGKVHGGGVPVDVETGSGDIEIE